MGGGNFVCGGNSKCCGNSCQAPGSKCCITKGLNYPVTKGTQCAGWNSGSTVCHNRRGDEFLCGAKSSCCGDVCAGAGSPCCQNERDRFRLRCRRQVRQECLPALNCFARLGGGLRVKSCLQCLSHRIFLSCLLFEAKEAEKK